MNDKKRMDEVIEGLSRIRNLRLISHFPMLALFVAAPLIAIIRQLKPNIGEAIWESLLFQMVWWIIWAGTIIGFFLGFFVRTLKCPVCCKHFHLRLKNGRPVYRNEFARKCVNCGTHLNGSNAHDILKSSNP